MVSTNPVVSPAFKNQAVEHRNGGGNKTRLKQKMAKVSHNNNDLTELEEPNMEEVGVSEQVKCSAVHSLERDMPTFDYSHLVREMREKMLAHCRDNPGLYSETDVTKCEQDDWFLSRFLLRQKLDVGAALNMLQRAMRFRHQALFCNSRPQDFPAEFYQLGGLFPYETDRKGNKMLYIRIKVHKKIAPIQALMEGFLYYSIDKLDQEAGGKGISIVLDCSGAGLANADTDMLLYLISTLVNYFPKGLSYFLVHELPWILKPFWFLAKAVLSEEHSQLIKFSNSRTIFEYVDSENLPDFMGGTCKRDYRMPPPDCNTIEQFSKLWGIGNEVIKEILDKFKCFLPQETLDRAHKLIDQYEKDQQQSIGHNE